MSEAVVITKREQLWEVPEDYLLAAYYTVKSRQVKATEMDVLTGMRLERVMDEILVYPQKGGCQPADFARWLELARPLSWEAEFVHPELWWAAKEREARYNAWLARKGLRSVYLSFTGHFVGPKTPPKKRGGVLSSAQQKWLTELRASLPDGVFADATPTTDPEVVYLEVWCPAGRWRETEYVLVNERFDYPACCAAGPTGSWARWWDGGPPDPVQVLEGLLEKKISFRQARLALKELLPSWAKEE